MVQVSIIIRNVTQQMIYMKWALIRYAFRRDLPSHLRDTCGLSALHVVKLKFITEGLLQVRLASRKAYKSASILTKLRYCRQRLIRLLFHTIRADPLRKGLK